MIHARLASRHGGDFIYITLQLPWLWGGDGMGKGCQVAFRLRKKKLFSPRHSVHDVFGSHKRARFL